MTDENALITLEEAGRDLATVRTDFGLAIAVTAEDFHATRALALSAQEWARARHLGLVAQNDAGAIAAEAALREGDELIRMAKAGERSHGGQQSIANMAIDSLPTLADLGIGDKESEQAQILAAEPDAVREAIKKSKAGNTPITLGRLERVARSAAAVRRRNEAPEPELPPTCDIRLGDFQSVLANIPDGSVDVILTDPPYPKEFLPLWSDLAIFAKRVLAPDGLLVAMSGQYFLPEVINRLCEHLPYRWTMGYIMPGPKMTVYGRKIVNQAWKPILVYGSSAHSIGYDVVQSKGEDKAHHEWGQSESGMDALLRQVADPGQVICDPFLGGGTTGVVALAYGCSFIGAVNDPEAFDIAKHRLGA